MNIKDFILDTNVATQQKEHTESNELNELFSALVKAQSEMDIAKTESANPYFKSKYANFAQIVRASRPALTKNGLAVIQRIKTNGSGVMYLCSRLCHTSGQWIESKMPINPPKNDIQSIGSYITYLKRYTYAALVGVASAEEDDDGEAAVQEVRNNNKPITEKQLNELEDLLFQLPEGTEKDLLKWAKIKSIKELPSSKFAYCKMQLEAKLKKNGNDL